MTAFQIAQRYIGVRELAGAKQHPLIQWWLSLCFDGDLELPDETPWCSAFANGMAWELRLARSKSARARSWLLVGEGIPVHHDARVGSDVVILKRGPAPQPEAHVIAAPGHVGFFAGLDNGDRVLVLGGNQGDAVSVASFPRKDILGIRRL